jgi:transposase
MPNPYSEDLCLRVVSAVENGKTTREVATQFQVSSSFVSNIHQCWQQTGHVHPKPIGGYRRALLEPYEAALSEQLSAHPSMTLKELQTWLESEHGLTVSISCIDKFIRHKLGYRYKKNRGRPFAATRRHRDGPRALASVAENLRFVEAGVSGRNQHLNRHDPPLWPGSRRCSLCGCRTGRPLTAPDLHCRFADGSADGTLVLESGDEWRSL